MNDFAIQAFNLSKRYRIGRTKARSDQGNRLSKLLTTPFQYLLSTLQPPGEDEILWALRDVSFDVDHGEAVGIIGQNGAGKSTLLKLLSRITEPTEGRAVLNGRVGSLLEVGTGFHPELTGRENIYLSGAILGMRQSEIETKFNQIAEFAGVERFLDTQVKRYSSGMYVRLAFAVAAHLDPEILIIDEVLAVGDAAFQKKCLGKMGDVAAGGRTVLFVSHNMVAVQSLCDKAMWLDGGKLRMKGQTRDVVSSYLATAKDDQTLRWWDEIGQAPGNDQVRIRRIEIKPLDPGMDGQISMDTPLQLSVEFWNLSSSSNLLVGWRFFTDQQQIAFTTVSDESPSGYAGINLEKGLYRSTCEIPANLLNEGGYNLRLYLYQDRGKVLFRMDDALRFEVANLGKRPGYRYAREPGALRPLLNWKTHYIDEVAQY
jgi:lipopolysaccharide transport system ATP-binding protein